MVAANNRGISDYDGGSLNKATGADAKNIAEPSLENLFVSMAYLFGLMVPQYL